MSCTLRTIGLFCALLLPLAGTAQVQQIPYQGYLEDSSGQPLTTSQLEITFAFYGTLEGGTATWTENKLVDVVEGVFTTYLGSTTTLPDFGTAELYLQLTIEGESLTPRIPVGTVPAAFTAPNDGSGEIPFPLALRGSSSSPALAVENRSSGGGIKVEEAGGVGVDVEIAGDHGVRVREAAGSGFRVLDAGAHGLSVINAGQSGVFIHNPTDNGIYISDGGSEAGIYIGNSRYGLVIEKSSVNGIEVRNASTIGVNSISDDTGGNFIGGLVGVRAQGDGRGIVATSASGLAGEFFGRVHLGGDVTAFQNLDVRGTLSKAGGSFEINHPLDPDRRVLRHSFVESPDMMNVYNGNVTLGPDGRAVVELPSYFEALNRDFRYQLTCIGGYAPVFVESEVDSNQFVISGGTPGLRVSWQVTGIRQDEWAEENRIVVEEDKTVRERRVDR